MSECRDCVTSIGVKGFFLCRILGKHSKRAFWIHCGVAEQLWKTGACPCVSSVCKLFELLSLSSSLNCSNNRNNYNNNRKRHKSKKFRMAESQECLQVHEP